MFDITIEQIFIGVKYLIYKITNKLNNKIYIGAHKTIDVDDGYFGSGLLLERAVNKYGKNNFYKEIIFDLSSESEMWEKEAELVDDEFVARLDTYNLKVGGFGGFDFINKNKLNNRDHSIEGRRKSGIAARKKQIHLDAIDEEYRKQYRAKLAEARKFYNSLDGYSFKGRKHSEESKRMIGEKNKLHQTGKNNSQYGKQWITDGKINRSVPKTEPIPHGFRKGRVLL